MLATLIARADERTASAAGRANRPGDAGPVRLARVSHEEPAESESARRESRGEALPLSPPGRSKSSTPGRTTTPSSSRAITTVLCSLAVVLGLFFLAAWFTRKVRPKGSQHLPKEVVETLGRAPLGGRQQMHLVRVGKKLLLISLSTGGAETLTEITDSEEVERLTNLCQMSQPGSVTATFRQVLSQFENEPAPAGFTGESTTESTAAAAANRRRRLARAA